MLKLYRPLCVVASCLYISSSPALAGNENGEFVVRGIGFQKCSYLNADYTNNSAKQLELSSWVSGYLTHTNKETSSVLDVLPIQNTSQFSGLVALICKSQPEFQIHKLVDAITNYFTPYHIRTKDNYIAVKSATNQIAIRQETIKVVQALLHNKGFLPETAIDGKFNNITSKALLDFQKNTGKLPSTGIPDVLTLYALLGKNG